MKILIKIEKLRENGKSMIARFCNWKSEKSIDTYKKRMVSCDELDNSNIVNFLESLGKQAYLNVLSYEKSLPTLPENTPIKLNEDMCIDDVIGKVICIDYPPKFFKKLRVRRVEL